MNLHDDVAHLSVGELGAAYVRGDVSPVEVVEAYLARLEAYDGALRSHVSVDREGARAAARAAERALRHGGPVGPLHGIPLSYKDNLWTRGLAHRLPFAHLVRPRTRRGRHRGGAARRGGCHHPRQDQHHRVRMRRPGRPRRHPQPLGPDPAQRRLVGGIGQRRDRRAHRSGAGERHRRVDPRPCGALRDRGREAHLRTREPLRPRPVGVVDGPRRSDDAPRGRRRADALRSWRAGTHATSPPIPRPVPAYVDALTERLDGVRVGVPVGYWFEGLESAVDAAVRTALGRAGNAGRAPRARPPAVRRATWPPRAACCRCGRRSRCTRRACGARAPRTGARRAHTSSPAASTAPRTWRTRLQVQGRLGARAVGGVRRRRRARDAHAAVHGRGPRRLDHASARHLVVDACLQPQRPSRP